MKITTVSKFPINRIGKIKAFVTTVTRQHLVLIINNIKYKIRRPSSFKIVQKNTYIEVRKGIINLQLRLIMGDTYSTDNQIIKPIEIEKKKRITIHNKIKKQSAFSLPDELMYKTKITVGKSSTKNLVFSCNTKDGFKVFKIYRPRSCKELKQGDTAFIYTVLYGHHSESKKVILYSHSKKEI